MEIKAEIAERLKLLEEKYAAMGQDLLSYLDGLLHADYLTYWDYIQLDTLLSLQKPKTNFPDEQIFIMYHQITELYFKLVLHETRQISRKPSIDPEFFIARMQRINRYFQALTHSFAVMIEGMERDQFLKFRMSLLPASGFQSAQYRMIEISATDFYNLVDKDFRDQLDPARKDDEAIEEMFEHIYWKKGATELATGNKTLTLRQFEYKYKKRFLHMAKSYKDRNMWAVYKTLPEKDQQNKELINTLKFFDINVNINWPLVHYKSAVRYLQLDPQDVAATGGTNWQKYLPPRFQKRIFYPELWTTQEIEDWGKGWVEANVFNQKNLV